MVSENKNEDNYERLTMNFKPPVIRKKCQNKLITFLLVIVSLADMIKKYKPFYHLIS